MGLEAEKWAWKWGGMKEEEEKEEKEEEKIPLCETIGHRPLRGRCPKSVRWSGVPVAPKLVNVRCEGESGSGPEGANDLCLARI